MHYISRFNPYGMDDQTILAVSTAREKQLERVLTILKENLTRAGACQHMMIYGPRGRGKSFFVKYVELMARKEPLLQHTRFVLFPEEQSNVKYASDLLRMILAEVQGKGFSSVIPAWSEPPEAWVNNFNQLKDWVLSMREKYPDFMLVIIVENFNDLLETLAGKSEKEGLHRLRHLLEHLPHFTLLGASPTVDIDGDYNNPIFKMFSEIKLTQWKEADYIDYFRKRKALHDEKTGKSSDSRLALIQEAKLKAISQYTGGSPRIAVVLSDLILEDNLLGTAKTLNGLIDDLTPYYQDLFRLMRNRQNSLTLFDALIRSGENLSQSALAEKVGARQSDIAKAFNWLLENGFVQGHKRTGSKEFIYIATDRVMVLYYLSREIRVHQGYSPLWMLADFLVEFYTEDELKQHAHYNLALNPNSQEAQDVYRIYRKKKGLPEAEVMNSVDIKEIAKNNFDLENTGLHLYIQGEYQKCIEYLNNLLNNEKLSDSIKLHACYSILGNAHRSLGDYPTAIKQYSQSILLAEKHQPKNELKAFNLGRLGWCHVKLEKYSDAIIFHQEALDLCKQEGNISEQAWNLGQLGWCHQKLEKYSDAIIFHQEALNLCKQEGNISEQAWNLGQLGWCHQKLEKDSEAIVFHQEALELRKQERNISGQAWNLGRLGWCHEELEKYTEAIIYYREALELRKQERNISGQAWNLGRLGWCHEELEKYTEAIIYYREALDLRKHVENISEQDEILGRLGWSHKEVNLFEQAISYYLQAIELKEDREDTTWEIGQICVAYLLSNNHSEVWSLLLSNKEKQQPIFKEWGDAIEHTEKRQGRAEAFKLALSIMYGLSERQNELDLQQMLTVWFADLIHMKVSDGLITDIADEAKRIFTDKDFHIIMDASLACLGYRNALKNGTDRAFLETLHPDMAILVQAIAKEAELTRHQTPASE